MKRLIGGSGSGGGTPGGSDTQIQFNDAGVFGGDVDLTWNKTTNVMTVAGDVNLSDGGSFTTTLQTVTPTANRTVSIPDATGTVALVAGSSGQPIYNNAGAYAGLSTATIGTTGNITLSLNGAASTPPVSFTGTWFTGGTATTTKPHFLIEPTGTTSTAWSTSGTGLGVNAASGFAGRLLDLQVNGTSNFSVDSTGRVSFPLGAVGTPSLYPGTDTNTGLWSPAADTLAWSTNGSERARIDSSGNVLINTTASASYFDGKLRVESATTVTSYRTSGTAGVILESLWHQATTGDNNFITFGTETTHAVRGSITYNRTGGLVAYNTTSDYRAKTILGDIDNSGEAIDALKVYRGVMNGATVERPMLVAHEAQEVAPYCVTGEKDAVDDDGNPIYQQMDHQALVPLLIAEIQQLRNRVAALEGA